MTKISTEINNGYRYINLMCFYNVRIVEKKMKKKKKKKKKKEKKNEKRKKNKKKK